MKWTDLGGADVSQAGLQGANLAKANLARADVHDAHLEGALFVGTNLKGANLSGCWIYGISAWDLRLEGAIQSNLVITPENEPVIQVDGLEVAQFIYLLLNNHKIRQVLDSIRFEVVLILGRFTLERKSVLDAIRDELRMRNYLPVLFDFDKPATQTTVETIKTLALMSRFVIADLTDPKSILQELEAIVPSSPSVVVQPLLLASEEELGMLDSLRKFPWFLNIHRYTSRAALLEEFGMVIAPAEAQSREWTRKVNEIAEKSSGLAGR